jgi:hypothetical protein
MEETIELLRQIVENTKPDNLTIWIAAISSSSALLGALIGALLLYRGIVRQITTTKEIEQNKLRATIISTERLRWLQEIRKRTSEFYANLDMHYNLLKRPVNPQQTPAYQQEGDEFAKQVMVECNQITLLLNPAKNEQKRMREACNKSFGFLLGCMEKRNSGDFNFDDAEYARIKTEVFDSLTNIGVEAWGKIKQLQ